MSLNRFEETLNRGFPFWLGCDSSLPGGSRNGCTALSLDIRHRFEKYILAGLSGREAARRLMLPPATGARLAGKVRRGESLVPAKCGRPVGWGVMGAHKAFLIELVEQDPDITLTELRDALAEAGGVEVHYSTISYALRRFGFTYKKRRWQRMSDVDQISSVPGATG
ncbi:MAG: hypothetical protein AAGJ28_21685 [Pseudomonadota bacterium]